MFKHNRPVGRLWWSSNRAFSTLLLTSFICLLLRLKMVKLGNHFSEKNSGKVVSEDGFDTIPLITPLDASQLQFPPPEKVRRRCFPDGDVSPVPQ